jgi:hypothetical protein
MSPMFQALQALQKRRPLSRLRPVINVGNCAPKSLQRSRAKEIKLARNNQVTNHSPSAMLVMAARDLTNHDRMRLKWVASESRHLLELLLLPRLDTEL